MTTQLTRPPEVRRLGKRAFFWALVLLAFSLAAAALGLTLPTESWLLNSAGLVLSFQWIHTNISPRRDVICTAASLLLTALAMIYMVIRVAG